MRFTRAILTITLGLFLAFLVVAKADGHRMMKVHKNDPAWVIEKKQFKNMKHAFVAKHHKRWHHRLFLAARREHGQLQRRFVRPWLPTADCETVGPINGQWYWFSTVGLFEGGLQFLNSTWASNGGLFFAAHAYDATPIQQVTIAKRLTYDGWPNCPNP